MQELLVTFTLAVAAVSLGILSGAILAELLVLRPAIERKQQERDRRVQELLDQMYPDPRHLAPGQASGQVEDFDDGVWRNVDLCA